MRIFSPGPCVSLLSLISLSTCALALAGCGGLQNGSAIVNEPGAAAIVGGRLNGAVRGGETPITGAKVRLYAVGTSGYGPAATLLATTTTNSSGNFGFVNGTAGANTGNSYVCPASSSQIYISSVGGITDGSGNSAHANTAAVFLAPLGACGSISSTTPVTINELVTAAAVTALAQYISPGTVVTAGTALTAGTFTVGTGSSTQAQLGLANAVAQMGNLANVAIGQYVASTNYVGGTGGNSTVAGITVTATPESSKLITMADVLVACVNTTSNASAGCNALFAAATPPAASTTSQPTANLLTATDTLQAAYYMATFPAQSNTIAAGGACGSSAVTALQCEYALATASSPFQPTLGTAPTDWTIGVTLTASGTCNAAGDTTLASTGPFINGAYKGGIDAKGNLWFVNANAFPVGASSGTATLVNTSEVSPVGAPLACLYGGTSGGRGLTIDPSGNVWSSFSASSPANIKEATTIATATGTNSVAYTTVAAGTVPTPPSKSVTIASDGSGNIGYILGGATGTAPFETLYLLTSGGTSWTAVATFGATLGTSNAAPTALAVDHLGRFYSTDTQLSSGVYEAYPSTGGTGYTGKTIASTATSAVGSYGLAVANITSGTNTVDVVMSGTTCCGTFGSATDYKKIEAYTAADDTEPGTFTLTESVAYAGGINGVRAVGVDGAGNIYASSEIPVGGSGTLGTVSGLSEVSSGLTSISPIGVPTACATTGCVTNGSYQKASYNTAREILVDPSGTVWTLDTAQSGTSNAVYTGATITQAVGVGVPVVTPLSVAANAGTLGQKP